MGRDAIYQERLEIPKIPLWLDGRMNWFERECMSTLWDEKTQKAKKGEGESDDLLQAILGASFNAHNNAERSVLTEDDLKKMTSDDPWYRDLSRGNAQMGIEQRSDIADKEDTVDPELGYVVDDRDMEFDQLNAKFNEIF